MRRLILLIAIFIHSYVKGQQTLTTTGTSGPVPLLEGTLHIPSYNHNPFSKELKWSDFIGVPYGDEKILALTSWNISLGEEWVGNQMSFIVIPEFVTDKSFTRTSDSTVLVHERYHYALVELYAAKIQKAISSYHLFKDHKKVEEIYNSYCNKLRKLQDLYDKETDGSRNKKLQSIWQKNIDHELAILNRN